jgi:hypothetical protein
MLSAPFPRQSWVNLNPAKVDQKYADVDTMALLPPHPMSYQSASLAISFWSIVAVRPSQSYEVRAEPSQKAPECCEA